MADTPAHNETADSQEESRRPRYDDINTPVILMIGVISALLTYMTIAFVEGLCYHWTNAQVQRTNYDVQNWRQVELIEGQKRKVTHGPDQNENYLTYDQATKNVLQRYSDGATSDDESAPAENQPGGSDPSEGEGL